MKTKIGTIAVTLTLLALAPVSEANTSGLAVGPQSNGCGNSGVVMQAGVGNNYECNSVVQYCHQGTGSGAGAGAGGPGQNEAGAQASAGTDCQVYQDSCASGDDDEGDDDEGDGDDEENCNEDDEPSSCEGSAVTPTVAPNALLSSTLVPVVSLAQFDDVCFNSVVDNDVVVWGL